MKVEGGQRVHGIVARLFVSKHVAVLLVEVNFSIFEGLAEQALKMFKLAVSVKHQRQLVPIFNWHFVLLEELYESLRIWLPLELILPDCY